MLEPLPLRGYADRVAVVTGDIIDARPAERVAVASAT
jgi:hypothetical protein